MVKVIFTKLYTPMYRIYCSMFQKLLLLLSFAGLAASQASAQAINNLHAYKNINSDSYFRFSYDNDFFSATDQYYTQGIDAELVLPQLKKFPASRILVNPKYAFTRYGIGLQHNGYTPSSISSDDILYGNRPFAGCIMFKSFLTATDTLRKQRFSSSLHIGVIGPSAGAKEMQEGIHRALANITPHGWQHQIQNDLALNYQVDYEKQLLAYKNYFSLSGSGSIAVGTLNCKATIGATLMAGYFISPFSSEQLQGNNFRIYAYDRPEVSANGYDATLQGGVFNKSSPYTLFAKDMEGITFRNRAGFVIQYHKVCLEYFGTVMTREFTTGKPHAYGGVQFAVAM